MSKITSGDTIKHKKTSNEYTVVSINPYNDTFIARSHANSAEVDFSLTHFDDKFEVLTPQLPYGMSDWLGDTGLQTKTSKCECGVDSLGAGLHSSYCPKYGEHNG